MSLVWNRRISARHLWSALIIATFVLCMIFLYKSFSFGKQYGITTRNSAGYSTSSEKLTDEECIPVCDSEECVYQSKIVLNNIQPEVNPCDDFYKFACGKFLEKSAPDEISTFVLRYLNKIGIKLKNILDNLEGSTESASGKMKIAYDSCMKYSSDLQAVPTVLQLLNSFGIQGWPNLAPDFNYSLASTIGNILIYQEYGFVKFSVESTFYFGPTSQINMTVLIGESSYQRNKEESLRKYQVDRVLSYFNLDTETINEIWEESEAINNAIINLREESESLDDEENENSPLTSMDCTLDDRNEWTDLCASLESFIDIAGVNKNVNKDHAGIRRDALYFMQNVFSVLGNFSDRSVANYLALNVFFNHLNELNFYFRLIYQKDPNAYSSAYDTHEPIGRWQHCVKWITRHMPMALTHEFSKKEFTVTVLEDVRNLTKELIQETKESISRQKWMSEDLLSAMTEQIASIYDDTGRLIEICCNEEFANGFYEEFHPVDGSFLYNILEHRKFMEGKEMRGRSAIELMLTLQETFMPGASGGDGEISISPAILLPPTYLPRLQRLINMISLGIIIVHEVGHNVQSVHRQFMESDQGAKDYYNAKSQCIAGQFSQFRLESIGKNLNGSKYSHENNADNIAVPIIDKLIEKYVSKGEEISLPAFPYSTKQLLYISAAQAWCTIHTKEKDEQIYTSGFHSPTNFRLLGMMQNSKGFSEAFDCPIGSYMNPSTKCLILTE